MKILFIDGTKGFTPRRLEEKPTGGILTSLTLIPRYLAKKHDVTVCSLHEKTETYKGVRYTQDVWEMQPDVVVCNRNVINEGIASAFPGARLFWWLHDIVDHRYLDDGAFQKAEKVIALSQYNVDSYSDFYGIPSERFTIIPNGVDDKVFYKDNTERDPDLYICASAPVKGLYPVEFSYYNLKRFNPNAEFRLYVSQGLHDLEDSDAQKVMLNGLKDAGISVMAPIPQKELADVMRKAWCLLMPNHYPEICSNLLLQAQACGLPVISVPIGSVPEYIRHGHNGLLTKTYPHDMYWWWKDYASLCIEAQNKELHKKMSENSYNPPAWDEIGRMWEGALA